MEVSSSRSYVPKKGKLLSCTLHSHCLSWSLTPTISNFFLAPGLLSFSYKLWNPHILISELPGSIFLIGERFRNSFLWLLDHYRLSLAKWDTTWSDWKTVLKKKKSAKGFFHTSVKEWTMGLITKISQARDWCKL